MQCGSWRAPRGALLHSHDAQRLVETPGFGCSEGRRPGDIEQLDGAVEGLNEGTTSTVWTPEDFRGHISDKQRCCTGLANAS